MSGNDETMGLVLDALETVLMGLSLEQRRQALMDSVGLYEARGFVALARAIRERLEKEPQIPASPEAPLDLASARVTRDAPETLANFAHSVSFEESPGCGHPDCRAFILGVEAGRLSARLDAKPPEWSGTYHAENVSMLERVASAKGYSITVERSADPAWVFATYAPAAAPPRLALVPAASDLQDPSPLDPLHGDRQEDF